MNRQNVLRYFLYAALFVSFTLLFTLVNYPSRRLTQQVNGWISAPSGGVLSVKEAHLNPTLSLAVKGVTLKLDEGSMGLGDAVVRPRLLGLLTGKKGAGLRLENPWMTLRLAFAMEEQSWDLDVKVVEIDLSGLPEELMALPLNLDGELSASMKLTSDDPSGVLSDGKFRVTSGSVEAGGDLLETLGLAPLRITGFSAVATVKDNVVTLGECSLDGDLAATASGTVRIAPGDLEKSRLDLAVELSPGPGKRERLAPILALMGVRPGGGGSVNLRIRGTAGRPSVTR